ncbi:MAG TPA: hypothetical protein VGU20_00075 [Stellaceae bacterium]|nr:hypothetical protein [Stellaceae bacterium]
MMLLRLTFCALSLAVLAACYNGPNLRDCSEWRTDSIPGCYDGQGGGGKN